MNQEVSFIKRESGAVLIILALALSVIILFIGLGVDTAMLGSSHQKQSRTSELGALAAIEAFLASPSQRADGTDVPVLERLETARGRAEQVVGFDTNKMLSKLDQNQASINDIGLGVEGLRGMLEPGQYFFSEPSGGCATFSAGSNEGCPCNGGSFVRECFRPHSASEYDGAGADERPISAFRMSLQTLAESPVHNIFTSVGGGPSDFSLFSSAISTITPRHVVFLIDMSGSMTTFSHHGANSNLDLVSGDSLSSSSFRVNSCTPADVNGSTTHGATVVNCSYPGEVPDGYPDRTWSGVPGTPWAAGMPECRNINETDPEDILTHYRDDYECFEIQKSPIAGSPTEHYLIETKYYDQPNADNRAWLSNLGRYRGAEPLSTVLDSVHRTLRSLAILSVPGDEVTFIGFDKNDGFFSTVAGGIPDTPGPRVFLRTRPGEADFAELLRLTNVGSLDGSEAPDPILGTDDVITQQEVIDRVERLIFPLSGAYTDLPRALLRAYALLSTSQNAELADNQVVVFSDGVGNCPHVDSTSQGSINLGGFDFPDMTNVDFLQDNTTEEIIFVDNDKRCSDDGDPGVPDDAVFEARTGCPTDIDDESEPTCVQAYELKDSYVSSMAYEQAFSEVKAIVQGEEDANGQPTRPLPEFIRPFRENGYKLHAFLFGKHISPHTLVIKGANGCMTEAEARQSVPPIAYADQSAAFASPANMSTDEPFLQPNYDFQFNAVSPSSGRYFPIREACRAADLRALPDSGFTTTAFDCEKGDGVKALNNFCRARGEGVGDIIRVSEPAAGQPVIVNGRLVCDPYCKGQSGQVTEGINSLFQDNPIITIEPPPVPATPPTN